jgi:signal transduction histidine kinase
MRIFMIIFWILLIQKISYAQNLNLSNKTVNSKIIGQSKINNLNKIAFDIYLEFPDSAHKIAANALILSEKSKYAFGKGNSFLNLGIIYWSQSYYPISLFFLQSAITNLPKNKPLYLSDAYAFLGRTYADLKDYKKALNYLDTSMYFAGNDTKRISQVFFERAYVYYSQQNYDKELGFIKHSLKLDKSIKNEKEIAILYAYLSNIYLHKKDYKAALAYEDTSFNMSNKVHNRRLRAYTYYDYALINNELGKYNDAIKYAQKGIALSHSIGVIDAETKCYSALIKSFELKNDLKRALIYQKKYNLVSDSLSTIAKLNTIKLVQDYYDLNSKISNLALITLSNKNNQAKIRNQNAIIVVLCLSLIILTIVLSATYYFYKEKKLLSNKLQNQHKELLNQKQLIEVQKVNLQMVNSFKDRLLAVIGHDLRTPIANLSNIVEMFETGYLNAEELNELMKDINSIVKGTELTLSNLIEWAGNQVKGRTINSSNVDIFLLGVEMEQTFAHSLHLKNIAFINYAYPGRGVLADENHLKVILRNLIGNAIKFTSQKGSIILSTAIENNEMIIAVQDNGRGMTIKEMENLFHANTHFSNTGTAGEKGTGIGLLLCKELVELNGGQLKVESILGKGSKFYFKLPLIKAYA